MTSEQIGDKEAGNYHNVLYEDTVKHSSIKFTQDCIGGVIWVESTGRYPICPHELEDIAKAYKHKKE